MRKDCGSLAPNAATAAPANRVTSGSNKEEIQRLADRLGESVEQFEKKYVKQVGIRKSLKEIEEDGSCIFFQHGKGCTVYEDRPAAMPKLALLGQQPEIPGDLGGDLPHLPGIGAKASCSRWMRFCSKQV